MKRSALRRRTPSARTDPDRIAWKAEPHAGFCECGCDRFSLHLQRHHVIYEQHCRAAHGSVWDLANSMLLHPDCHRQHHAAIHRVSVDVLPEKALAFAVDLFGEAAAALYIARYYWCQERAA